MAYVKIPTLNRQNKSTNTECHTCSCYITSALVIYHLEVWRHLHLRHNKYRQEWLSQ